MTDIQLPDGLVLRPGDPGFDDLCGAWNGRFSRRPDLIARCASAADVAAAVTHARSASLRLSVKSGGHSYAGLSVGDGGLLVDLSRMTRIDVDPVGRTADVEPGVTCGDLDAATQQHGLATPTPTVSSVGVIGAALGGGSGYLSRRFGLTLDNVLAAEIVTADGHIVEVSADQRPDLFWAIRGGGGNFGIVTKLRLRLHRLGPEVLAGQVIYPFSDAGRLLRTFRDFMDRAPEEFQCYPFCFRVPPIEVFPEESHGKPFLDFVVFHQDPNALDFVAPLRQMADPILDVVGATPYVDAQKSFDANLPKGQRYLSKAHDLGELTDGAIDVMVDHVPRMAGALTAAYFDPLGGAIGRVGPQETPYAGRASRYGFHIIAGWQDAVEDEAVTGWAGSFHDAMSRHATGGVYVNLIGDDELDRVPDAYGSNYERLVGLKAAWDPANLFAGNYNIPPDGSP